MRETLTYAAKLRLPSSINPETRSLIVEQTIQELGLSEAADTVVGGAGRKGISGGEKRRLSIGCVLVSFPSVLVLDEVTTGLGTSVRRWTWLSEILTPSHRLVHRLPASRNTRPPRQTRPDHRPVAASATVRCVHAVHSDPSPLARLSGVLGPDSDVSPLFCTPGIRTARPDEPDGLFDRRLEHRYARRRRRARQP